MKRYFLLILLSVAVLDSQAQWKKVSTPTTKDLYDVQIVGNIAYAVGNTSAVIKSSDTGKTWKNLTLTIASNLRSLHFLDSSHGFVIGENARIQRTRDGGKTWAQKYIRTAAYGYDITFHNNYGIAVGKDMLAVSSADTGNTWTVDTTFARYKKLNSVTITPGGNCWAVGDSGYILNKNVNQKKWKVSKYPTKVDLNHVSHVGDEVIIIAGGMPDSAVVGKFYNILLISADTGHTWQQVSLAEMKTINSAYFYNKDTGFLAGSNGLITRCYHGIGGRGMQLTGTPSTLSEVVFFNGIGMAVGDGGVLLRTNNAGGNAILAVKQELDMPKFMLSPNPCNGEFSLQAGEEVYEVSIMDCQGRMIHMDKAYTGSKIIAVTGPGLYSVVISEKDGSFSTLKLVVQ